MLWTERQHQCVLARCRLQLEVELAAETLAQRQPPRLVHAAAEGRMQNELHAAGLIEESLEDERLLRGNRSQRATAFNQVRQDLFGSVGADARFVHEPR